MSLLSRKYTGLVLGAIFTGLLVGLAFPTVTSFPILSLVLPLAFVPLLAALECMPVQSGGAPRGHVRLARNSFTNRAMVAFLLCWLSGFVFELLALHWLPVPIMRVAGVGQAPAFALALGYGLFSALRFPLVLLPFIANSARGTRRVSHPLPILAMAVVSMGIELLMPHMWPWKFGGIVAALPGLAQWTSLFGAAALTPFVLGTAAWMARSCMGISGSWPRFALTFLSSIAIWSSLLGLGEWRRAVVEGRFSQVEKNFVGIIQSDFDLSDKIRVEEAVRKRPAKVDRIVSLTQEFVSAQTAKGRKIDLVVWPSGVLPAEFFASASLQDAVRALSKQVGVPILLESLEFAPGEKFPGGDSHAPARRSACLFRPDGSRSDGTYQLNPIPFQESIPLESMIPSLGNVLRAKFTDLRPWRPGVSVGALPFSPDIKAGVLISYDVTSPEFVRRLVGKQEAGLLVHLADFTSLTGTTAPAFLQQFARSRAVEFGRSVVSASNTGPSAAYSLTGEPLPIEVSADGLSALVSVPVLDSENFSETLYSELGEVPMEILSFVGFLYLLAAFWRRGR